MLKPELFEVAPVHTEQYMNWHDVVLYCQFLNVDGKQDWRLPTIDELFLMSDGLVADIQPRLYWSSSEGIRDGESWVQGARTEFAHSLQHTNQYAVRAIRTINLYGN